MRKIKLISLLTATLFSAMATSAEAGIIQLKHGVQAKNANNIHVTILHTNDQTIPVSLMFGVGSGDENNCNITTTFPFDLGMIEDNTTLLLNSDELAVYAGLGYTCAQELYQPKNGIAPKSIQYALMSDGKTYTSANPDFNIVDLN